MENPGIIQLMSHYTERGEDRPLTFPGNVTRPALVKDANLVHALYEDTPSYFDIISIPIPTLAEVATELITAVNDPRRFVELVLIPPPHGPTGVPERFRDPVTGREVAGYLDYKLDYPEAGDATVNLLLVRTTLQNRGIGKQCVADLEERLAGKVGRVLASIYGRNPRAEHFWKSLGYTFAIDAKPVLDWYAKTL